MPPGSASTAADWVFPSFLFAVGGAMSFAFQRPTTAGAFAAKVLRRGALIFLLGFLMYWYPFVHRLDGGAWALSPFADTRVMGVLQRIALCYVLAAFAVRYLTPRKLLVLSACCCSATGGSCWPSATRPRRSPGSATPARASTSSSSARLTSTAATAASIRRACSEPCRRPSM